MFPVHNSQSFFGKSGKSRELHIAGWKMLLPVIERMIAILPNFKQYVKCVDEKNANKLGTKSSEVVKSICQDNVCWCCKLLCAFGTEICDGPRNVVRLTGKVWEFCFGRTVGTLLFNLFFNVTFQFVASFCFCYIMFNFFITMLCI